MKTEHETMGSTWTVLISTSIPSSSEPTRWNRLGVQTHTGVSRWFLGCHMSPTPSSCLPATLEWLDKVIHAELCVGSASISSLNIGMYTPSKASGLWESKFLLQDPCRVGTSPVFSFSVLMTRKPTQVEGPGPASSKHPRGKLQA